ncbi:MAG TPA: hypothetical protein VK993_11320 [Chthoniobacterales bacterium]|nr:hypothetical protein [Chthoniobacterales bacterium]
MNGDARALLTRIRILIGIVIVGLVVSGLTAFPLVYEINMLQAWAGRNGLPAPVSEWLTRVHEG